METVKACLEDDPSLEKRRFPTGEDLFDLTNTLEQQLKLAQLCLDKGVDVNQLTFDFKLTPLDHAINANQTELAEFLQKNGGVESKHLSEKSSR